ncbi:hypothetical protein FBZ89_102135 [Nitrospirillum amazonense]|uniref:MxaH protein n=1 Tax=Nitrospirillum amazonense TaxID=28077 RepID=A0A560FP57_9PROT|nr:hypothetical protein [Nitrospirillum amazonense]TWB23382.1 hypothetical protein FBZ89_102135 [Nitrospirillum amazonense]
MRVATCKTATRVVLVLCGLALMACDDGAEPAPTGKVVARQGNEKLPAWLDVNETMEPALWLRRREVGRPVLATDPEVDRLRRALRQAAERFIEEPRMIANRTAQISDALMEMGQPELAVDILVGMIDVADATAHKQIYGALCQHYLNLRKSGMERSAALARLVASYKAQNNL